MPFPQTQAARVIGKFGGIAEMAAITGYPAHRLRDWMKSGFIPPKYWMHLLACAAAASIDHTPWDYIAHLVCIDRGEHHNAG